MRGEGKKRTKEDEGREGKKEGGGAATKQFRGDRHPARGMGPFWYRIFEKHAVKMRGGEAGAIK